MNKIRIIGLGIIFTGIIIQLVIEHDIIDFISGLLIGVGLGVFLITKKQIK